MKKYSGWFLYGMIKLDLDYIYASIAYYESKGDTVTVEALKSVEENLEESLKYYQEYVKPNSKKEESK